MTKNKHVQRCLAFVVSTVATFSYALPNASKMQIEWQSIDGCAKEISIVEYGKPLVVGCASASNMGNQIFRRIGSNWVLQAGAGIKIADLGNAVSPLIVDKSSNVWRGANSQQPDCAVEVAASSRPDIWSISCRGGFIQRANNLKPVVVGGMTTAEYDIDTWLPVSDAKIAKKIAVGDSIWMIDKNSQIYTYDAATSAWTPKVGCARDIAANQRHVWVIGCASGGAGGNEIFKWTGSDWQKVKGAAVKIAVDNLGNPWAIDKSNQIWTWTFKKP